MRYTLFCLFLGGLLFQAACVRPKLYRAELAARNQAEAREKTLNQELLDRKAEAAELIKQVGQLNRAIGSQDAEISDLRIELSNRTKQMGESSSKLAGQVTQLENDLAAQKNVLDQRTASLQKVQNVQKDRRRKLEDLQTKLTGAYAATTGVKAEITPDDAVALTLPDKSLFNADGVTISAAGKAVLKPLADLLAERPELDVELIAYTDNSIPKDKSLKDTWDWSLVRATNVVRFLIREFNTNANQLTPVGRGEFYPVASNATAEGRLSNRRTVAVVRPVLPALPAAE